MMVFFPDFYEDELLYERTHNRAPEFPTIEKKNDQRQQPSGFSFAEKDIYFVVGETKNTSKWETEFCRKNTGHHWSQSCPASK